MSCYSSILLIVFSLGVSVSSYPVPYGPPLGGPFYSGIPPVPFYNHPLGSAFLRGAQVGNDAAYYGGNKAYGDFANNDLAQQSVRDNSRIINQARQGHSGNHLVMRDDERNHGHGHAAAGAAFEQGENGMQGGARLHDTAANQGFQGFGEKGQRKGHHTSGFHKSYHNVESGKNSKFVDEDHSVGEENFGQNFDNLYNDKAWDGYDKGVSGGAFKKNDVSSAAGRDGIKSAEIHDSNWDARDHTKHVNNQDLAYQKNHLQVARNNQIGMGQSALSRGVFGKYY